MPDDDRAAQISVRAANVSSDVARLLAERAALLARVEAAEQTASVWWRQLKARASRVEAAERAGAVKEIAEQRRRNHEKWGELSIENRPPDYRGWLPTLGEEYGEVCRALTLEQNDPSRLRAELIDLAAVAHMWIDSIDRNGANL